MMHGQTNIKFWVCLYPYLSSMQSACAVLFVIFGMSDSTIFFFTLSH